MFQSQLHVSISLIFLFHQKFQSICEICVSNHHKTIDEGSVHSFGIKERVMHLLNRPHCHFTFFFTCNEINRKLPVYATLSFNLNCCNLIPSSYFLCNISKKLVFFYTFDLSMLVVWKFWSIYKFSCANECFS